MAELVQVNNYLRNQNWNIKFSICVLCMLLQQQRFNSTSIIKHYYQIVRHHFDFI